jgi:hypothetical protein
MQECVRHPDRHGSCAGAYWYRPFSGLRLQYWNTRQSPNGSYLITVHAFDLAGNMGQRSTTVTVKN